MINYAYLNSLDWCLFNSEDISYYESNNDEYMFDLYKIPFKVEGFINKKITYRIVLVITDIKSNVSVDIIHDKLVDLWNNIVKEGLCIQEKIKREVDL